MEAATVRERYAQVLFTALQVSVNRSGPRALPQVTEAPALPNLNAPQLTRASSRQPVFALHLLCGPLYFEPPEVAAARSG
jgi:hypothetical protein